MKPFIDTNVLVYANDPADRRKQHIARETLLEHAGTLVLSAQVLAEFYSVVTRTFSPCSGSRRHARASTACGGSRSS